jgi:hypothetical protein
MNRSCLPAERRGDAEFGSLPTRRTVRRVPRPAVGWSPAERGVSRICCVNATPRKRPERSHLRPSEPGGRSETGFCRRLQFWPDGRRRGLRASIDGGRSDLRLSQPRTFGRALTASVDFSTPHAPGATRAEPSTSCGAARKPENPRSTRGGDSAILQRDSWAASSSRVRGHRLETRAPKDPPVALPFGFLQGLESASPVPIDGPRRGVSQPASDKCGQIARHGPLLTAAMSG